MKRFALSHTLPVLGALAFAAACTDATSPNPHAALRPQAPTPAVEGNVPPPPTRTAITVTVSSTAAAALTTALSPPCPFASGGFEGTYFANGRNLESTIAATEIGDLALGLDGTAWLRIDKAQPEGLGTSASANARFQKTDQKFSGRGTLTFANTCVVVIEQVTQFIAHDCFAAGQPCAEIVFTGTINGQPAEGTVVAFDRDFCEISEGGFFCSSEG